MRRRAAGRALMAGLGLAGALLLAATAACLSSGCSTLAYYGQAVGGHLDIVQRSRPVADWLADETTPPALRARLARSQQMRDFAVSELKLPDNSSYRRYADLQRDAVVWNLVAAPELSLTLRTWCYPLMGCVGYRGSFDRAPVQALAAELQAEGWETSVYGVPAYSTLGWTNWMGGDPLLNTFIGGSEAELARLMFHELAHQVAYASDDTAFNESFATAVERLGGRRWLAARGSSAQQAEDALLLQRREAFRALTLRTRQRLEALYTSALDDASKRLRKAELMALLRSEHAALKAGPWQGYAGYDGWIARANNASFAVQAAYTAWVPAFEALFVSEGGDFTRFYTAVQGLAALPKDQRRARLDALAPAPALSPPAAPPSAPSPP